ncbi:hypothetical protein Micbo1qcDRAFT_9260 [Microdochium bolleyi]|uniref:Uncharacterized protein n=1 Tax=Microdochium bolleyi TaxID=196109 RepID=A0A136JKI0_9PEZI|nr:hypothetical protein Micbo1qcDRAFT_9260 [Microdochium bolleyi]
MEQSGGSEHTAHPAVDQYQAAVKNSAESHKCKPTLSQSEPRPAPTALKSSHDATLADSTHSVPTLRFPRPVGSRQLSNWISSSSPDIMQPETLPDEDQILADLGYDVIGADGESQAESIASSFDYQRPDDVQSLCGTDTGTDVDTNDADTDSSDDEEEVVLDDTGRARTYAEIAARAVEEDDVETPAVQSLENPTSLLHHSDSFPELAARARTSPIKAQALQDAQIEGHLSYQAQQTSGKQDTDVSSTKAGRLANPAWQPWHQSYFRDHCRPILRRLGLLILGIILTWASLLLVRPTQVLPQTLSTVPVASVSTSGISMPTVFESTIPSTSKSHKSAPTPNASNLGTSLMPVVLDRLHVPQTTDQSAQSMCSAEVYGRNEIMVKIPLAVKASWLAKEAIKIAVSRDGLDIPTSVTTITAGFLIEVPVKEAHGTFEVSIVTERKPKIHEVFKVDLGQHTITDVLDVSKQFVKDLALYVANAVNETTTWVHDVSAPAVDEGTLLTQTVLGRFVCLRDQLMREATTYFSNSISKEELELRSHQAQVELKRATLNLRDDLSLTLLTAQLSSKLWWLKIQGKQEEYQSYLANAEAHYKGKMTEMTRTKAVRGENVKRELRERRSGKPQTSGSIWRWRKAMD